jgi:uncharacterized protein
MKLVSTGVRQRSNFGTRRRWQGFLIRALAYSMIIYGSALVMLLLIENSILYPAPKFPSGDWDQTIIEFEDASFTADDETKLHGWFVPHSRPRGTLLYFHGNAENVSYLAPLLRQLNEEYSLQVLAFDYRGYGKSEGTPFEKGLHRDSRAALKWLNERTKTKPSDVIFYARSLGGGVAIDLAAEKGCKALVLENTFSSMTDVASSHYPWLPVKWFMRNRYPSERRIKNCTQPITQSRCGVVRNCLRPRRAKANSLSSLQVRGTMIRLHPSFGRRSASS